jgi:hypothetical protein
MLSSFAANTSKSGVPASAPRGGNVDQYSPNPHVGTPQSSPLTYGREPSSGPLDAQ